MRHVLSTMILSSLVVLLVWGCDKTDAAAQQGEKPVVQAGAAKAIQWHEQGSTFWGLDISQIANADYAHDPFEPGNLIHRPPWPANHFPGLPSGVLTWQGTPLFIRPSHREIASWSVATLVEGSLSLQTPQVAVRRVIIAVDGGGLDDIVQNENAGKSYLLSDVVLRFEGDAAARFSVFANKDVWDYHYDKDNEIPSDRLIWSSREADLPQSLVGISFAVPPGAGKLKGIDFVDFPRTYGRLCIFAVTLELEANALIPEGAVVDSFITASKPAPTPATTP